VWFEERNREALFSDDDFNSDSPLIKDDERKGLDSSSTLSPSPQFTPKKYVPGAGGFTLSKV
jgi:hypothetical protein